MKIGIDLGGTKVEAVVIDECNRPLWRERTATPQGDYQATITMIKVLVGQARREFDLDPVYPVGIGTPGALTHSVEQNQWVMKNCNSVALNGRPLLRDLEAALRCPVRMANDANCFALAETMAGSGQTLFPDEPPPLSLGIILGTGVGSGIVVKGALLQGQHAIAGEWGHNTLPAESLMRLLPGERGRACYCGRRDCIETYISGPGLAESYQRKFGETCSPEQIIASMREGDVKALAVWEAYLEQLAASLAQVVNILDPQLIVLGGGMSTVDEIYPLLPKLMAPHVFTDRFTTPIKPALLGDSAGVYGAAWLW
jgi:fructokinase